MLTLHRTFSYAFKAAPSRGAFFNHEIRDRYTFREVTRRPSQTVR